MTTKLNNISINSDFEHLLAFKNEDEKTEHDAQMISFRILSEVEKLCDEMNIKRKDLAEMVGTSKSYITQLFNGTKCVNTSIMAKFESVLDVTFEIFLKQNVESFGDFWHKQISMALFTNKKLSCNKGSWYFFHLQKNTSDIVNKLETDSQQKQIAA